MRNVFVLSLGAVLGLVTLTTALAVPQLMNYQGILFDGMGDSVTNPTDVVFAIWDDPTQGDSLWSEIQQVTPDSEERFNVLLGSVEQVAARVRFT